MNLNLPTELERQIDDYRASRKAETGKVIQRHTTIIELLRKALTGFEPLDDLERAVEVLKKQPTFGPCQ